MSSYFLIISEVILLDQASRKIVRSFLESERREEEVTLEVPIILVQSVVWGWGGCRLE